MVYVYACDWLIQDRLRGSSTQACEGRSTPQSVGARVAVAIVGAGGTSYLHFV